MDRHESFTMAGLIFMALGIGVLIPFLAGAADPVSSILIILAGGIFVGGLAIQMIADWTYGPSDDEDDTVMGEE